MKSLLINSVLILYSIFFRYFFVENSDDFLCVPEISFLALIFLPIGAINVPGYQSRLTCCNVAHLAAVTVNCL